MNSRIDKIMSFALPFIVLALSGFYYLINPIMDHYPIQCIWKVLTGTQCPACGFQRALHAVLHGQFKEALSYNYFFVVSIPLAIATILSEWYNFHHIFDGVYRFIHHQYTIRTYILLYFSWWVLRNLLRI